MAKVLQGLSFTRFKFEWLRRFDDQNVEPLAILESDQYDTIKSIMTDESLTQTFETALDADIQAEIKVDMSIDTCGTRCPIPLLRAKQALKTLATGEHLEVLASDPSAKPDFDAMLRHLPHCLVSYTTQTSPSRIDTFIIRKGE